ncbi:hypothetical protein LEP1GSC170_1068, partial [Leptospira interrogans serovar Bataviae str. HAI135]
MDGNKISNLQFLGFIKPGLNRLEKMSKRLRKITLFLFCSSIVAIGLSVSISQGFLILAFLFSLFSSKTSGFWKEPV